MLVLSQYVEEGYALELVGDAAGGVGYLLKDRVADVERFIDAVKRVAEGGSALDPEVVSQLVGRARREDPLEELTPREREVLELMAEGRSNTAIAAADGGHRAGRREARDLDLRQARPAARAARTTAGCWQCSLSCAPEPRRPEPVGLQDFCADADAIERAWVGATSRSTWARPTRWPT